MFARMHHHVRYLDSEGQARLVGLCTVLQLPPLRCNDGATRRPLIEIEIETNVWRPVESFAFDDDGTVTFFFGKNGTTRTYRFALNECPAWRMPARKKTS